MPTDDVNDTLEYHETWLTAEREVDELNGDAGSTVAWVIEAYMTTDQQNGDLYVFWQADGDEQIRDTVCSSKFHDWEVKYP